MAFPDTGVLETFTGADGTALGASWSGLVETGTDHCEIKTNRGAPDRDGVAATKAWGTQYDADQECYFTYGAINGASVVFLYCRLQTPGTAGVDGYVFVHDFSANSLNIYKITNGAYSASLASASQAEAIGDKLGLKATGTTIEGWYKTAAGSWTKVCEATSQSDFNAAGYIGFGLTGTIGGQQGWVDDFGGGNSVASAANAPSKSDDVSVNDTDGLKMHMGINVPLMKLT